MQGWFIVRKLITVNHFINKIRRTYNISVEAEEEAFDKIRDPFLKAVCKPAIE